MEYRRRTKLLLHHLRLHFGVAIDVLLIGYSLFLLSCLLGYFLPVTTQSLSSLSYKAFVLSTWNMAWIATAVYLLGTVAFLPPTQRNRRRSQTWLILMLCCQAILVLLPDREDVATIAYYLTPFWIGNATLIVLLTIESRTRKSDWLAVAESLRKVSLKDRLKKGFAKLGAVAIASFVFLFFALYAISLTNMTRTQLASRSWPVAKAKLVRCEMIEGINATWNSDFHLEYTFEVGGAKYTGNDYDTIQNKPTAIHFNAAKETVEQLNSSETLQVAYNPTNPSQNLLHPGLTGGFALTAFVGIVSILFHLVVFKLLWTYLATSRFTDPASVYRVTSRRYDRIYLTVLTIYVCTMGFLMLAARVPISTSLFAALMTFIAILICYSGIARSTQAHSTEIVKQKLAGKTIVYGLNPS